MLLEIRILKFFDQVEVLNILLVYQLLSLKLPLDTLETWKKRKYSDSPKPLKFKNQIIWFEFLDTSIDSTVEQTTIKSICT